jgi:hypothetical protein
MNKTTHWFVFLLLVSGSPIALGQAPLYVETFPYPGGAAGDQPLTSVGWANDVIAIPNRIYLENDGVVFAFSGTATTEAFYTSTTLDTGATGQAFPTIDPTDYQFGVSFFIDIRNGFSPEEVRSRFAVQIDGGSWYSSTTLLNVPTTANGPFANYELPFDPSAANWDNLTVTGTGSPTTAAAIGGPASADLTGSITGAGLVVTYGPPYGPAIAGGGTHDFDNFMIAPTAQPGDVDLDTDVDLIDLNQIRLNFRQAVAGRSDGDLTNDGFVDFNDFVQWRDNYPTAMPGAFEAVPEPTGAALAIAAMFFVGGSRRKRRSAGKLLS